jgi:hypothetical protein
MWWWKGNRQVVGIPCLLPECPTIVPRRTGVGRQAWYCNPRHREDARSRRRDLAATISGLEAALATTRKGTRGVDRRELQADLRYLQVCLLGYAIPEDLPADRA